MREYGSEHPAIILLMVILINLVSLKEIIFF